MLEKCYRVDHVTQSIYVSRLLAVEKDDFPFTFVPLKLFVTCLGIRYGVIFDFDIGMVC